MAPRDSSYIQLNLTSTHDGAGSGPAGRGGLRDEAPLLVALTVTVLVCGAGSVFAVMNNACKTGHLVRSKLGVPAPHKYQPQLDHRLGRKKARQWATGGLRECLA